LFLKSIQLDGMKENRKLKKIIEYYRENGDNN